jgi:hypothetical protein
MSAAANNALPMRVVLLRALVARQGGEWTPARVKRAYIAAGVAAPSRSTHRRDLGVLHRLGDLDLRESTGRRWYTPSRRHTDRGNRNA